MNEQGLPLRVAYALMAVLLGVLPLEGTTALRNVLLAGVLVAFLWHVQVQKDWRSLRFPLWGLWLAYAGVAVLGLFWAVDVSYSLGEIRHEILTAALVFGLAWNLFARGGLAWLVGGLLVGNLFMVAYCLVVWQSGGTTVDGLIGTFQTGVGNFSTYLVMVFPWLVWLAVEAYRRRKLAWAVGLSGLLVCNVAAMFVTENRQVFTSILLEMVVVLLVSGAWRRPRLLLVFVLAAGVFFGGFAIQSAKRGFAANVGEAVVVSKALETDGRLARWRFALSESLRHPWSGGGLGRETFKHLYPEHEMTSSVFVHTHNMILNRLVQLGLPGTLLFLALFFSPAVCLWRNRRQPAEGGIRDLHWVGLALCTGMFAKNMTDDFFMRELGYFYWIQMAGLLGVLAVKGTRSDMKSATRFLIVRRDNIGDLLCTTPLMRALRERYPQARIDALVNSYNAPVLAGNPDLNHVYCYTKAKHRGEGETVLGVHWQRIRLMWLLRQVAYDVVILAGDGNVDRQLGLSRWLNAGNVIGFAPEDSKLRRGLDVAVPRPEAGHEVERTFSLLAPLGIHGVPPKMVLVPDQAEVVRARSAINRVTGSPTVAIHISARKIPQRWPIENFAQLMRAIHAESGARFVLFWSPGDENNPLHPGDDQKAAVLMEQVSDLPVVAYPTHRLLELIAALSLCEQMVCSDGGAMHIGAALGLPEVVLFGNSDIARWHPWGGAYRALQENSRDVVDIRPQPVFEAVYEISSARASAMTGQSKSFGRPRPSSVPLHSSS